VTIRISRRKFMAGAIASGISIVPASVLAANGKTPPSEKLNIAGIGVGGVGGGNLNNVKSQNIVAICDIDEKLAAKSRRQFPRAKYYKDFRRMLEKQKDIEAVIVATPDHTHAVITLAAIQAGKGVYTQKPLTYTPDEARRLTLAARKYKVATQMGNQGHSSEGIRICREWIRHGAIGDVTEVYTWTDRPIWPQGIDRPSETPPIPPYLDWNLWIGPAPMRPYHPAYHPFKWRGWWDFGTGALGDMGCHIIDTPFWALDLPQPTRIYASSSKFNSETAPVASIVRYEFPPRNGSPAIKLHWYDGGLFPPRPDELEPGRNMPDNGVIFVGTKGTMFYPHGAGAPRLLPEKRMRDFQPPPKTIPRIETSHEMNWVRACKGGPAASSNFDYAGPLSEMVLLGNAAIRAGKPIEWDAENMKITNLPDANKFVRREYRDPWSL